MFCCVSVWALTLPSVRPNCDLRVLQLNALQKQQLGLLRRDFKQQREQSASVLPQNHTWQIHALMANPEFDAEAAQRLVAEGYRSEINDAVAQLHFYHHLYQMLTPVQQRVWLEACVRKL